MCPILSSLYRSFYVLIWSCVTVPISMFAKARHSQSDRIRSFPRLGWALVCLSVIFTSSISQSDNSSRSLDRRVATVSISTPEWRISKRATKGDTLLKLLEQFRISPKNQKRWLQAVAKQIDAAELLDEKDDVHFYFTDPPWASLGRVELTSLRIERSGSKPQNWHLRHGRIVYHGHKRLRPEVLVAKGMTHSGKDTPQAATSVAKTATKLTTESPATPAGKTAEAPPLTVRRVTHVLRKGENLGRVLRAKGIYGKAAQPWIQAISKKYPLKRLYAGKKIALFFVSRSGSQRSLGALQIESRRGNLLTWQRNNKQIEYRGKHHRVVESDLTGAPSPVRLAPPFTKKQTILTDKRFPPTRSFEPLEKVLRTIRRGQTLGRILRPLGITGKEGRTWFAAIDEQYPITKLRPGQRLHLYFNRSPNRSRKNNLKAIELEVRKGRKLTWERVGNEVRFGSGLVLGRRRTSGAATQPLPNGPSSGTPKGHFLSEYALARIKQRNGLLEYAPLPKGPTNGTRPTQQLESAERVTHRLKLGQHLWGVLRKYETNDKERRLWLTALQQQRHVRRLRAGSNINLYFKTPGSSNGAGNLQALEIVLRSDLRLTWYRSKQGILFYKDEIPYQQEVRSVSGGVTEGSLYGSAKRAGINIAVISRMVDIFAWDINFQQDLRPGDTYRILYRRKFRAGHTAGGQIRILAAEFVNKGRTYKAIYFQDTDGQDHYYNALGHSVSRSFLRYPVEFRRISSRFSLRRFHPVLKVRRPHYGVDFAARTGTPVRTVADGRITHSRWKGAYGRLVEVSHGGGIKTRYAHLRRYGPGIRRRVNVKKGQTIGYVGCSGLCTGPHLHFEMWQDNRYVNPLKAKVPVERQLDPLLMEIFQDTKELFFERLEVDLKTVGLPTPTHS